MSWCIITKKGYWNKLNEFVDEETGEVIRVLPSKAQSNKYIHFPIHCYMQYEVKDKWNSIINILEIDDSDYTFVGDIDDFEGK